jgi:hypothetical protein
METNAPSIKESEEPSLLPPPLPVDDALRLATLARVPETEREQFLELVYAVLANVRMADRRSLGSNPGPTLVQAAELARALHQTIGKLATIDGQWVEHLRRRSYEYQARLRDVPITVFQLASLLSVAACMSPPRETGDAVSSHQKSSRDRTSKYPTFSFLACWLKILAREYGGKLGDRRLLEVIKILNPHLPHGSMPKNLTLRTLKRVHYVSIPALEIWSPEPPA